MVKDFAFRISFPLIKTKLRELKSSFVILTDVENCCGPWKGSKALEMQDFCAYNQRERKDAKNFCVSQEG
jgi:hypothetical protein